MFCPECKAEYRSGFTRCSDCDVDLVSDLTPTTVSEGGEALRIIWEGGDETDCVSSCRELANAGIQYKVSQIPKSRSRKMVVNWRYEIAVRPSDYEQAKECLGIEDDAGYREDETDQTAFELPAAEGPPADEGVGGDSYLGKWHPEDATVEVWSEDAEGTEDTPSIVELSLKENLIRFRSHGQDGTRKFFVLPEDEFRAREIVREIMDSTPPN